MNKKEKLPPSGTITNLLLLTLAGTNIIWLITSRHGGTLIALLLYSAVVFLCLRNQHFRAGVITGIFGFGIHIFELLVQGTSTLIGIEQVFFYLNLFLPIPLTFTSYLASRKVTHKE
ncbi:MAG: hypothetical protein WBB69_03510 [Anaerolineales bacterium]